MMRSAASVVGRPLRAISDLEDRSVDSFTLALWFRFHRSAALIMLDEEVGRRGANRACEHTRGTLLGQIIGSIGMPCLFLVAISQMSPGLDSANPV
jgi:hypothetical protein